MSVTVRPARGDELAAVGELTVSAYGDLVGAGYAAVLRDAATRAEVAEVLVAVDDADGGIVGTVTLVGPDAPPQWRETEQPQTGTIRMLAVSPVAQGRGVGTTLTLACIERGQDNGWKQLTLLTQPSMQAAQRIYARLGFIREPALDKRIGDDLTLLGFFRDL